MFARIENGVITEFPVDIRAACPHVSFPADLSTADAPAGFVRVEVPERPAPGPGAVVELSAEPSLVDGKWRATWVSRQMSGAEAAEYERHALRLYSAAVQQMLDAEARTRHYDGILSACSYAASTSPRFGPEGRACFAWREACWHKAYEVMEAVRLGQRSAPTVEQLLAEMPQMVWPA